MKISEAFPGKYLRCADLQGREVKKKIAYCETEKVGMNGEEKPVLHFINEQRGMVVNKTNANTLAYALGDDSEQWRGREIVLYPTRVDFAGKPTDTIRVRAPSAVDAQAPFDDSIPF